ncbi:MAG: BACON domain-containing protein, partial [Ktedonobacteraceae bacterium]
TSSRSRLWLGLIVVLALLLSGVFGVVIHIGRTTPPPPDVQPTLQVVPATVALGGIITVRGIHFTPDSVLALSRDRQFPLVDTGETSSIQADTRGNFSDTVIVDPGWLGGRHMLYATDIRTHHHAAFSLTVTGQSALQGPPHLLLSADRLDFGAGDEASNASKLLALSNAGGGQLIWQASSGQSWLQISPMSGSIPSGDHMSVIVALDRAALSPGTYTTSIVFTSNTEQITLPVSMKVIPLQPAHQAVLQLSPAVLTFNATARGSDPQIQALTISNPGIQPLHWGISMVFQNNRGHWLRVSSQAGVVVPGSQQQILIGVSIQGFTPGVYRGALLFFNQGPKPVQGSPQSIPVSLTVAQPCTLAFASGNLSFTGIHGQA